MALTAAQLVFANVAADLSPARRDGYQIWLRTPEMLSDVEGAEIQNRVADFESRRDAPLPMERHLFFPLSTGRFVVSRSIPLAQGDEFHRGGRFYAHAIILDADDFATIECDPFAVLDGFRFHDSLEDGQSEGDPSAGILPPASIVPATTPSEAVMGRDQLLALLKTVMRICQAADGTMIGLPGSPKVVLRVLRQLFPWLPPSMRCRCSFDTLSTGRSLTACPFTIAGLPSTGAPRRYTNLLNFDVSGQSLPRETKKASSGYFEEWLVACFRSATKPPAPARLEAVLRLGSFLDGAETAGLPLRQNDIDEARDLLESSDARNRIHQRLQQRLVSDVGPILGPLIEPTATEWFRSRGHAAILDITQPLDVALLSGWLVEVYTTRVPPDLDSDRELPAIREAIERIAGDADVGLLRKKLALIYYRWSGSWGRLARSVADPKLVPDAVFDWFVAWSLETVSIEIAPGLGRFPEGIWVGPVMPMDNAANNGEGRRLIEALLGVAPHGRRDETDFEARPPEVAPNRWRKVVKHLMRRIDYTEEAP
jgi:hypothetical protein